MNIHHTSGLGALHHFVRIQQAPLMVLIVKSRTICGWCWHWRISDRNPKTIAPDCRHHNVCVLPPCTDCEGDQWARSERDAVARH